LSRMPDQNRFIYTLSKPSLVLSHTFVLAGDLGCITDRYFVPSSEAKSFHRARNIQRETRRSYIFIDSTPLSRTDRFRKPPERHRVPQHGFSGCDI
jgi:hypothetical protein